MLNVMILYARDELDKKLVDLLDVKLRDALVTHAKISRDIRAIESKDPNWEKYLHWRLYHTDVAIVMASPGSMHPERYVRSVELPILMERKRKNHEVDFILTRLLPIARFKETHPLYMQQFCPALDECELPKINDEIGLMQWAADRADLLADELRKNARPYNFVAGLEEPRAILKTNFEEIRRLQREKKCLPAEKYREALTLHVGLRAALYAPRADIYFDLDTALYAFLDFFQKNMKATALEVYGQAILDRLDTLFVHFAAQVRSEFPWPDGKAKARYRPKTQVPTPKASDDAAQAFTPDESMPRPDLAADPAEFELRRQATIMETARLSGDVFGARDMAQNSVYVARAEKEAVGERAFGGMDFEAAQQAYFEDLDAFLADELPDLADEFPEPDDETRKQWEGEAAVKLVMGEEIPRRWRPFLRELNLSGRNESLFRDLKEVGVDLDAIYVDKNADIDERVLKLANISLLAGLTALERLWLNNTQVADISPLAGLNTLATLSLSLTPKWWTSPR